MKSRNLIIALLALLFVIFGFNIYGNYRTQTAFRPVPCLDPEVFLKQHQHAVLQIVVDGIKEAIPTDIGVSPECESALHTHDGSGTLHVEAQDVYRYTLGDFFRVWQKPVERPGYTLTIFLDGAVYDKTAEQLVLKDQQQIILSYTKAGN